jgi:hypothetical protein
MLTPHGDTSDPTTSTASNRWVALIVAEATLLLRIAELAICAGDRRAPNDATE